MKKIARVLLLVMALMPLASPALFADEAEMAGVGEKLKEIIEKQDQILAELETLKSELDIVKIRVSSR
jgi:hypothetical protein